MEKANEQDFAKVNVSYIGAGEEDASGVRKKKKHRNANQRAKKRERTARWLAGECDSKPKSSAQPTYVSIGTQTDEPSPSSLTEREAGEGKEFVGLDEVVYQEADLPVGLRDGDANGFSVGLDGGVGGDGRGGDSGSFSNVDGRTILSPVALARKRRNTGLTFLTLDDDTHQPTQDEGALATIQMSSSPNDQSMAGIKGKRIPGRPGRFDPSEPLHMTTRRAAKTGPTNGSPSANGSMEDGESRRGSLDDFRPKSSHSNGSIHSVKIRRASETSFNMTTPQDISNGLPSSEEKMSNGKDQIKLPSPVQQYQQTQSPSRKRKRSSVSPQGFVPPVDSERLPSSMVETHFDNDNGNDVDAMDEDFDDEGDNIQVIDRDNLSDRNPSQQSSFSDEALPMRDTFNVQSIDVTPAESGPISPVTSESGSQDDDLPLAKPLEAALDKLAKSAHDDEGDAADDVDMDVDGDLDMDGPDDVDDQAQSDEEGRPRRRFGGRRRAQHPIPQVEKAMQRQAELKSAFRALARAQKAAVAEAAQRTIDSLEANPNLHREVAEWQHVVDGLDNAYSERSSLVNNEHLHKKALINTTEQAQREIRRMECVREIETCQDNLLDLLVQEVARIARTAEVDGLDDETDDEDDVIPKLKGMTYRWERTAALGKEYESRSRIAIESERAVEDVARRNNMLKLLEDFHDSDEEPVDVSRAFTVMDSRARIAANEKRNVRNSLNTLAAAVADTQRRESIPIIKNEEAIGLQVLGDLATRPSIRHPEQGLGSKKHDRGRFLAHTPSRPMPAPLRLQTGHAQNPIPVEMSPRTTQAIGDRFENSMPPPTTPRQVTSPLIQRTYHPLSAGFRRPLSGSETTGERGNESPHKRRLSESIPGDRFPPSPGQERRVELPFWRDIPRNHFGRLSARDVPFTFGPGTALREARQANSGSRPQESQEAVKKEDTSPFGRFRSGSSFWPVPTNQTRAPDSRERDHRSPTTDSRTTTLDLTTSPRPHGPSMSFSSLNLDGRQREDSPKGFFPAKPKKEHRDGLSRKQHWASANRGHRRFSNSISSRSEAAGSPPTASASLASGTPEPKQDLGIVPHQAPPQPSPVPPPPPATQYQQPPYRGPPSQPSYSSNQQGRDVFRQRSIFTNAPSALSWAGLPPTPLFMGHSQQAPNQQQQHQHPPPQMAQPPPGLSHEQYNRPFAPPPPPGYQPPPLPQHPTQSLFSGPPQSAPVFGQHQFGGPTLAPATPGFSKPGFRPGNHPPAFAQQQQQQTSSRRRTQSDSSSFGAKFHPWNPPNGRRN